MPEILWGRRVKLSKLKPEKLLLTLKAELLSKSIRPLPDDWTGLKDEETRTARDMWIY